MVTADETLVALMKLTSEERLSVLRLWSGNGESQRQLAREFGVNQTTIGKIVRRERWRQVA